MILRGKKCLLSDIHGSLNEFYQILEIKILITIWIVKSLKMAVGRSRPNT